MAALDGAADGDAGSVAATDVLVPGGPEVDGVALQPASTSTSANAARAVIGAKDTRIWLGPRCALRRTHRRNSLPRLADPCVPEHTFAQQRAGSARASWLLRPGARAGAGDVAATAQGQLLGRDSQTASSLPSGSRKTPNQPWPGTSAFGSTTDPPSSVTFWSAASTESTWT